MRILYLCTYYHRAMIFRNSMDNLIKFGNKIDAFNAVAYNTKIDEKYMPIMDDLVIHKECFNKWDRFFFHLKQLKIYKAMIKECNIKEYDIIHSHTLFNGGYAAYLIHKYFGIPYVVSVRNTDVNVFLRIPIFKRIANKIVKNASGVQFLSVPYKKLFIGKYVSHKIRENVERKSVVINNGLEEFWLQNTAKPKKLYNTKSVRFLCVGKIDKNKNIETTIRALKILSSKGYDVKLTIVGQVLDEDVFNNIRKQSFVNILEYLPKEELLKIYRENDIFIMPSITESFGRVYAEAMTQGLPVVYTKGQGFDGIFEDGSVGYAVPSKDAEYIAECIIKIIEDYNDISSRCINNSSKFDWSLISKKLNNFYLDSLNRREESI